MESIIFTTDAGMVLAELLDGTQHEDIFIVADKHTVLFCDRLFEKVDWLPSHVTVLDCGEENKSVESVSRIWMMLSKQGARRSSILVCVGGGVVTDLGGFAASTFKRGMRCINVPTTLLAQVDASLGGKTGFNFNGLKNEIGTFSIPEKVIIDTRFLNHLPVRERMSGFAEMIKHGLLSNREYLIRLLNLEHQETTQEYMLELIRRSVTIKNEIVTRDPREQGLRKVLNFGHTIGHAIESLSIMQGSPLLHGEAVALGLVAELYLSVKEKGFPEEIYREVRNFVKQHYPPYPLMNHVDTLYELMLHDKKNERWGVNFTLLSGIGEFSLDNYCSKDLVVEALSQV
ncbi:3-dehydroquinate synthase [Butyricimonas faecalis]|uniref:3-dehydroquinate synthase n=1 Tax=Butyricimonas faecalis TaxID=2093856 RepID=A0A3S9VUH0_9BACT|nr:3-dehydroquinate synthase [Butyricimonas faecalis]AZS30153.1 3-dehydroquinate synthase [Butyricimonas faecalis]